MSSSSAFSIVYVTASRFKREENKVFCDSCKLSDGKSVHEICNFIIREIPIRETLESSIEEMVKAEVREAYKAIKVPCIVEHAGLIFDGYESYPGGLTKPMWNTLAEKFVTETGSAKRGARARAVVAYCDGKTVRTFVGETKGHIAEQAKGSRAFYWDTVFIPDDPDRPGSTLTFAEIVDAPSLGLPYKVARLSQSTKAMLQFVEFRRKQGEPDLWRNG
jgi:non-canonical purine NTP pyrophosphatase (RdgB/HAM1 family)